MGLLTSSKNQLNPDENNNCNISPNDRRNIYYFEEATSGEFTIVVDTNSCEFGDELILLLRRGESNLKINFPSDKFILTYCGGTTEFLTLTDGNTSNGEVASANWVLDFYFNGVKFLSTFDTE